MRRRHPAVWAVAFGLAAPWSAAAQPPASVSGHVAVLADAVPKAPGSGGRPDGAAELRARVAIDARRRLFPGLGLRAALVAEGLVAERSGAATRAATLQPQEITARWSAPRLDLSIGMGQVVWGRLDEFQPTDVVNPLDFTRFFLEGRAAARRAVGLGRAQVFLPAGTTLDAVVVPFFRPATFDVLDEATSPFTLTPREVCRPGAGCLPVRTGVVAPAGRVGNTQGGARLTGTSRRIDWALMAWRGFESLPVYTSVTTDASRPGVVVVGGDHPRTTVVGGDLETVRGAVGVRAEVAWHLVDTLQAVDLVSRIGGRSLDLGMSLDRRAGDSRLSLTVLMTARMPAQASQAPSTAVDRRDVQIVAAADRSFARDTRRVRAFAVHNPGDDSAFVRAVGSWSLRDGWWVEGSGGWFTGRGADSLSRLEDRDFLSLSLTVSY